MNPNKPAFPPKPEREEDFSKPVAWLLGRELIEGLKWIVLYTVFKGKLDPRDWMTADVFPPDGSPEEFWQARNYEHWDWKVNYDSFFASVMYGLTRIRAGVHPFHSARQQSIPGCCREVNFFLWVAIPRITSQTMPV